MTTIAYKDGWLAADTLLNMVGMKRYGGKITRHKDATGKEYLVASAGNLSDCAALEEWYNNGAIGVPQYHLFKDDTPSASMLVVHEEGWVLYVDVYGHESSIIPDDHFAIGSGSMVAMGAMLAGASAIRAVEIAAIVDPNTGGAVDWQTVAPRYPTTADEHQHASDQRHKEEQRYHQPA